MKFPLEPYKKRFSTQKMREKLQKYAQVAGVKVVYSALLMFYAYRRKETPSWAKHIVLGTLGYFLAPFDAIPDLSPIIGYTDDVGVLSFGLVTIAAYVNDDVRDQSRVHLSKWFSNYNEEDLNEVDEALW